MRRSWLSLLVTLVISTGVVFAQADTPPLGAIGSFEAGDFRALAVTADGNRLLVADAENKQVRVYDFSDPAAPVLQSSLDMSGTPVLLAGGTDYGLVADTTDDGGSILEAVAPALAGAHAEYVSGWGNIEIGTNPHTLALSPDSRWGIAVSEHAYTLLQIDGVGDIGSLTVEGKMISAALSDTTAYVLHAQTLQTVPLNALEALQPGKEIDLGGTPTLVALNSDTSAGVVVVDGTRLVFFDPVALEKTGDLSIEGQPISSIHFLNSSGAQYLVVTQQDSPAITVLNAADLQNVTPMDGALSLEKPVTALTVFGQYVIASDGVTIRIFST